MKKNLSLSLLILLLAALMLLASCEKTPDETPDTTAPEVTGEVTEVVTEPVSPVIAENGQSAYAFVRADDVSDGFKTNFSNFVKDVNAATGVNFSIRTDWINPNDKNFTLADPEILVGLTNRAESQSVLASLPGNSYTIRRVGTKIVILGTDDNLTTLAMRAFVSDVLGNPARFADGTLQFPEGDEILVQAGHAYDLPFLMASGERFKATAKQVFHCPPQGDYNVTQGACSDGENVYFILRQAVDSTCLICKYRLSDFSEVKISGSLPLGHGSDMTYDAKNHRLVIARGNTEGKILGIVDPDTLEFVKDVQITAGAGAITYNEKLNRYVIGQGGKTWILLDENFRVFRTIDRTTIDKATSRGYITQGLGSDDEYVYFPMNKEGNTENILVAYTWEGKYVGDVTVPVAIESESMFVVGSDYYITFYKSKNGAFLYKMDFLIEY